VRQSLEDDIVNAGRDGAKINGSFQPLPATSYCTYTSYMIFSENAELSLASLSFSVMAYLL
jgi:hypothetical protein